MSSPRYWREIPQRYRYEASTCTGCGRVHFPPRPVCPKCGSRESTPSKLAEEGTIVSYTIIHVAPTPFQDQAPYAMAVVETDDGARLLTQITDCDEASLKTGTRVRIAFRKIQEEGKSGIICYGYKFVPVG